MVQQELALVLSPRLGGFLGIRNGLGQKVILERFRPENHQSCEYYDGRDRDGKADKSNDWNQLGCHGWFAGGYNGLWWDGVGMATHGFDRGGRRMKATWFTSNCHDSKNM
jgi:hypothetical protein